MNEATRQLVRARSGDACEYCRMPQWVYRKPFQIEHIVAVQHGGTDEADNLAVACLHCNSHKGPNLTGIDPDTGRLTRLFHPRTDRWEEHFAWVGHLLAGRTDVGRTTVQVLAMNDPVYRSVRAALLLDGTFPPS